MGYKWYVEYEIEDYTEGSTLIALDQPTLDADDIEWIFDMISETHGYLVNEVQITGITKIFEN